MQTNRANNANHDLRIILAATKVSRWSSLIFLAKDHHEIDKTQFLIPIYYLNLTGLNVFNTHVGPDLKPRYIYLGPENPHLSRAHFQQICEPHFKIRLVIERKSDTGQMRAHCSETDI